MVQYSSNISCDHGTKTKQNWISIPALSCSKLSCNLGLSPKRAHYCARLVWVCQTELMTRYCTVPSSVGWQISHHGCPLVYLSTCLPPATTYTYPSCIFSLAGQGVYKLTWWQGVELHLPLLLVTGRMQYRNYGWEARVAHGSEFKHIRTVLLKQSHV